MRPIPTASLEALLGAQRGDPPSDLIQRYLAETRRHLGMDVAYVAEAREGRRIFRFVDGERLPESVRVGVSDDMSSSLAAGVLDGSVSTVEDVRMDEQLRSIPEAQEAGIAGFAGVPLLLPQGRDFGALCVFSRSPGKELDARQMSFLQAFGRLIAAQLEHELGEWDDLRAHIERIEKALRPGGVSMVFQPIYDIGSGGLVGVEALARFADEPHRAPNLWFAEAWSVGRGVDLELAAVETALEALPDLPANAFLAVNVSAETVLSPRLLRAIGLVDAERIVLEVPERAPVEDHYALNQAIRSLRVAGARLAADDAGAGFESLSHILELRPEIIKFDISLTHDVDTDPVRRSLASSLVGFAAQFDATVVAEGIETRGELEALKELGFGCGQGYFLGRPAPLLGHPSKAP